MGEDSFFMNSLIVNRCPSKYNLTRLLCCSIVSVHITPVLLTSYVVLSYHSHGYSIGIYWVNKGTDEWINEFRGVLHFLHCLWISVVELVLDLSSFQDFLVRSEGLEGQRDVLNTLTAPPPYSVMYCSLTFMPSDGSVSARAAGLAVLITA